jgi:3-hydroxyacyl-CoA dehydrogenase
MTERTVAILGLGKTGAAWARALHGAGWSLRVFDPGDIGIEPMPKGPGCRRMDTISATVRDAKWVIVALPQRLELQQKVIQRAQAEAPEGAIVIATAGDLDLDQLQSPAPRPERVVQLRRDEAGDIALKLTIRNADRMKADVLALLSEIEGELDLPERVAVDEDSAKSA